MARLLRRIDHALEDLLGELGETLLPDPQVQLLLRDPHPLSDTAPHPIHGLLVGKLKGSSGLLLGVKVSVFPPVTDRGDLGHQGANVDGLAVDPLGDLCGRRLGRGLLGLGHLPANTQGARPAPPSLDLRPAVCTEVSTIDDLKKKQEEKRRRRDKDKKSRQPAPRKVSISYDPGETLSGFNFPQEEGTLVLLTRNIPTIVFLLVAPTKKKISAIMEGPLSFHLYVDQPLVCLTAVSKVIEAQRTWWSSPTAQLAQFVPGMDLWAVHPVDADTGKILGTRIITPSQGFVQACREAIDAHKGFSVLDPEAKRAEMRFLAKSFDAILYGSRAQCRIPGE